jgi:DNA-binding response OmpR family regulator
MNTAAIKPQAEALRVRRLLIVEDDDDLREELGLALRNSGFDVDCAIDGEDALAKLDGGGFDLLVTDIHLGAGPDGWRIAEAARALRPGIQVIYMSGEASRNWQDEGVPNAAKLAKPFRLQALVRMIAGLDDRDEDDFKRLLGS